MDNLIHGTRSAMELEQVVEPSRHRQSNWMLLHRSVGKVNQRGAQFSLGMTSSFWTLRLRVTLTPLHPRTVWAHGPSSL